ncbi:hypothetical protein GCM10026983_05020 [Gracilibacillus alcaliphilus]
MNDIIYIAITLAIIFIATLSIYVLWIRPHAMSKRLVLHAVLREFRVIYYSLFIWFKPPNVDTERDFTYHKDSQIKTIIILCLILITVEGTLFHFLLHQWSSIAAWIFTILHIYGLLYMIGFYNSVRYLPHKLEQDALLIRLGYQSSITVAVDNIESIKHAKAGDLFEKEVKHTYDSLLKIDSPQYEIFLKQPVQVKGFFGKQRLVNSVVFRADQPEKLLESIRERQTDG